jgi:lipoprotein-releasing system ATP-binding protein
LLQAKNIHKVYTNGRKNFEVLCGIDLNVEKGKFIAVVGPSGVGKSTLLHILGGLDKPTKGKVSLSGNDLYSLGDVEISAIRNRAIGFVFQFYHLLPEFTVLENVLMPNFIQGGDASKKRPRAEELLRRAGLGERMDYFPAQLSGGEKQRTAIVRGLINDPELFLCDEPTGNLDSKTGSGITALIREVSKENNMTVVLVTHNMELAKSADQTYQLKEGLLI